MLESNKNCQWQESETKYLQAIFKWLIKVTFNLKYFRTRRNRQNSKAHGQWQHNQENQDIKEPAS